MSKTKRAFPSKADVLARTPDPAVRDLLHHMELVGIETPFDRFDAQKPHCGFGLDGTCCKNCHMGPVLFALEARGLRGRAARDRARAYLDLVGLGDCYDRHPHQLSGGMKQRVAIARALAVEPSVLFMDEPFGALDTFTRLRLQDEVLRLWQARGPTVVFVTHDLDEAIYLGGKVILMAPNPGRIRRIVPVELPRPCNRTDSVFAVYRRELFEEFQLVHQERRRRGCTIQPHCRLARPRVSSPGSNRTSPWWPQRCCPSRPQARSGSHRRTRQHETSVVPSSDRRPR
jgi:ABC-type dipeptide/oligopeptide/nickel transport system ATPase subunit